MVRDEDKRRRESGSEETRSVVGSDRANDGEDRWREVGGLGSARALACSFWRLAKRRNDERCARAHTAAREARALPALRAGDEGHGGDGTSSQGRLDLRHQVGRLSRCRGEATRGCPAAFLVSKE